jgi:histidine phosphotransferase ChpT
MSRRNVVYAPLRMAEVMTARLCHDFAGPLGTLAGMLELVGEGGAEDALPLAMQSVGTMSARLRLVRAAWGRGDAPLARGEIADMTAGLPGAERYQFDFMALQEPLEDPAGRILLCLLLILPQALPRGGFVALRQEAEGVSIDAPGAAWPDAIEMAEDSEVPATRDLAPVLARLVAESAGWVFLRHGWTVLARPQ